MALENTFRSLTVSLHRLHDALNALHVTVGDKPPKDGASPVDRLESTVLDLVGILHEARAAALNARRSVAHPLDLDRARRMLATCQDRIHRLEQQFAVNLVSYEKLKDLVTLGSERRGEWMPWAGSAKLAIEGCRKPLEDVSLGLARCWQELAEHAGATSVSVRTVSIGQKINASPSEEERDVGYERLT